MSAPSPQRSTSRLPAASWALFDAANSAFPLVMTTAVFVLYFKGVVVGGDDPGRSDFLWGLSVSLSAGLVALTSPLVGAIGDLYGMRKRLLFAYTALAIAATVALSFAGPGMIVFAMVFFILANAGFEGGMVLYGSLLPSVATADNTGRLSGIGWALGYIGGLVCLLATMGLATSGNIQAVVLIVAAWFAVLSIPMFLFVPEPTADPHATPRPFFELAQTLKVVWNNPGLRLFFIAYFIYNDAIITVFSFAAPFAKDVLAYPFKAIILLIAAVQVTGAIGAFLFGFIADKVGHAKTIAITLMIWVGVTTAAFGTALELPLWEADANRAATAALLHTPTDGPIVDGNEATTRTDNEALDSSSPRPSPLRQKIFGVLALLVGFAMGASQASSRAFLATITPAAISGRLFGLYAVAGRFSAIVGPFLFGTISYLTGSKAWSVLALVCLFGVGLALIRRVDEKQVGDELRRAASHL